VGGVVYEVGGNAKVELKPWYEWTEDPDLYDKWEIGIKLPVSVGDVVGFAVCLNPATQPESGFVAFRNWSLGKPGHGGHGTSFILTGPNLPQAASGQRAYWVVERPRIEAQGAALSTLADYGSVLFQQAFALTDADVVVDPLTAASKENYDMIDPMAGNLVLSHGDTTNNPEEVKCVYNPA
jgi:hypothetical protein